MLARSGTCILALAKLGTPTTYVTPQCGLVSLSGVLRLGVRLTAGAFFFFFGLHHRVPDSGSCLAPRIVAVAS